MLRYRMSASFVRRAESKLGGTRDESEKLSL